MVVVVQLLSHVWLFCNPMACSPQGSAVHGIFQARILEWVAFPSSGDLLNPGIKPMGPALQVDSVSLSHCCCCQVASVVSDSVRPHGLQPTRLLHPWDSPGKNTGVGCHFLLQWKWKVKVKSLRRVRLLATPWTAAYQAPPSMGFSRQQYWSGVSLPSPHWATREAQMPS